MFEAITMVKKQKTKIVQKKKVSKGIKKSKTSKVQKKTMLKSVQPKLKQIGNYKEFLKFLVASDDFDCELVD